MLAAKDNRRGTVGPTRPITRGEENEHPRTVGPLRPVVWIPEGRVHRDRNEKKHPEQSVRSKASEANQGGRVTVSPRQPPYTFYIIPNGM